MTPLKRASRAYVNSGNKLHGKPNRDLYNSFRPEDQQEADASMRTALLALAECELPYEAIDAALMSIDETEIKFMPVADERKAPIYFRAICRALAEENGDG